MKDLDKTQVYDLRGITEEQSKELLGWLVKNDSGWDDWGYRRVIEGFPLEHLHNKWSLSGSKPTTHISTLFEKSYEEKLQEAKNQLERYKKEVERLENESKPKVGDVCKFWYDYEDDFVIGILTEVLCVSIFPYQVGTGEWFKNARKVSDKEVIDLLFKKS